MLVLTMTPRRLSILISIDLVEFRTGRSLTYQELADEQGIAKASAHELVGALVASGHVWITAGKRGMRLTLVFVGEVT